MPPRLRHAPAAIPPCLLWPARGIPHGGTYRIPLRKQTGEITGWAIIDADDYPLVRDFRWSYKPARTGPQHEDLGGYAQRTVRGGARGKGSALMHRDLLGLPIGDPTCVDHINGDGLDNRRNNLRLATHAQNTQNRRPNRTGPRGSSAYRGVRWNRKRNRWEAWVHTGGKHIWCGCSQDETEAAAMAREGRRKHLPFAVD